MKYKILLNKGITPKNTEGNMYAKICEAMEEYHKSELLKLKTAEYEKIPVICGLAISHMFKPLTHTEGKAKVKNLPPALADMDDLKIKLDDFIKKYDVTKETLAEALNISPGTLSKIMNYKKDSKLSCGSVLIVDDRIYSLETRILDSIKKK